MTYILLLTQVICKKTFKTFKLSNITFMFGKQTQIGVDETYHKLLRQSDDETAYFFNIYLLSKNRLITHN